MTQDEIIEMAKKAGAAVGRQAPDAPEIVFTQCLDIYRFATLVASAEREACAKLFDDRNTGTGFYDPHEPAEIIRERGR